MFDKKTIGLKVLTRMKNALGPETDKEIGEHFDLGTQAIYNWKIRGTIPVAREGLCAKDLVAVGVAGDSMDGTLADGDTVLIDRSKRKSDGVFAIRIGDALRIKSLQTMADGSLRVSSDNHLYQPETIHPESYGNIETVGQCYWRVGWVLWDLMYGRST